MVAFVIDQYYLVITLLITIGWQCLGFFIAWTLQVSRQRCRWTSPDDLSDRAMQPPFGSLTRSPSKR